MGNTGNPLVRTWERIEEGERGGSEGAKACSEECGSGSGRVSQKKEYTGCTELTAVQYSYSIFLNTGVYNITHYC